MEVGTIGFKKRKKCLYVEKVQKDKDMLKPLLKTKKEKFPDLKQQFLDRLDEYK